MARPVAPELWPNRMAGRGEVVFTIRADLAERIPVALLRCQAIGAQAAQQHIIRPRILGVQLQPVAFEPLQLEWLTLDPLAGLVGDREAEHWQPAVLVPVLQDAPAHVMAGLAEEAAVAAGQRRGGRLRRRLGAMIAIALLLGELQVQIAILLARLDVRAFKELVEAGQDHAGRIAVDHRLPGAAVVLAIGAIALMAVAHLDIIIAGHDCADERLGRARPALPADIEVVQRIVDIQVAKVIGAAEPVLIVVWVGLVAQLPPGIHATQRGWVEEIQRRLALEAEVGWAAHEIASNYIDRAG